MCERAKLIGTIRRCDLPKDCYDIHHHIENVGLGIIMNDTERLLMDIAVRMGRVYYPYLGHYHGLDWGGTTHDTIIIEMWW